MSTAKHTPGPWQARWQDPIDVDDCARIAIETAPDAGDIAGIHHATRGEDEANARLIAAAPDMLAALQRIAEYPRQRNDELSIAGARAIAAAAIAKATGEAQ